MTDSLRDEIAERITARAGYGPAGDPFNKDAADDILAMVRKHDQGRVLLSEKLRDEVAKAIALDTAGYSRPEPSDYSLADAVLAVVRRHVEALAEQTGGNRLHGTALWRDDVLRLLGVTDE